jgi:NTP pyrophosphatase (non-canonical NTP hydrolase)
MENKQQDTTETFIENLSYSGISHVAKQMYQVATEHGFHEGETIGEVSNSRMSEFIANLHGEVSELWEAHRDGKLFAQCNKPVALTCAEEELADIIIRAMDTAHSLGINIGKAIATKTSYNKTRPYKHGKIC